MWKKLLKWLKHSPVKFNIPEDQSLKDAVRRFNIHIQWYGYLSHLCDIDNCPNHTYVKNCKNCMFCLHDTEDRIVEKCKAFKEYAESKGYVITRPGYETKKGKVMKEFDKSILRPGMLIEYKDHSFGYYVTDDVVITVDLDGQIVSKSFTLAISSLILRVYGYAYGDPAIPIYIIKKIVNNERDPLSERINIIWEKEEEPKEMTVKEIEEALGHPVKIVKE